MKPALIAALAVALCGASAPVSAQQDHGAHAPAAGKPMDHAGGGDAAAGASSPVAEAFKAANAKMHRDMDVKLTGDADVDFVRSMIPHHQGAIDMAKIAIAHGKDPKIRKLADEIVKAQEAEIAQMRAWLRRHGQ